MGKTRDLFKKIIDTKGHPWDSPGKNTGVGCHFLLQCMRVKSESEVSQSYLTLRDPMDCSPPGSSVHGIFQARVLECRFYQLFHQCPFSLLRLHPGSQIALLITSQSSLCLICAVLQSSLVFHDLDTFARVLVGDFVKCPLVWVWPLLFHDSVCGYAFLQEYNKSYISSLMHGIGEVT